MDLAVLGWPMLGLLVLEFLFGMSLNLYTTLPSGSILSVLASSPILAVHFVVAVLLVGITARAMALALRLRSRRALAGATLGLVSTVVASGAGFAFAFGGQSAEASYIMSVGFVGVLIAAFLILEVRRVVPASRRLTTDADVRSASEGTSP